MCLLAEQERAGRGARGESETEATEAREARTDNGNNGAPSVLASGSFPACPGTVPGKCETSLGCSEGGRVASALKREEPVTFRVKHTIEGFLFLSLFIELHMGVGHASLVNELARI